MSFGIKETPRKILELLYWEGQIDPTYMTVEKIREEMELTDANIQDGLRLLHESGFVACSFIESDARVSEAKISMKGIDKAKSLLNEEF